MISYRKTFIFVHTPKAAGQSVKKALWPHVLSPHQRLIHRVYARLKRSGNRDLYKIFPGHQSVSDYQRILGAEEYERFFSFAFVRNPWDWMLSRYSFTRLRPNSVDYELAMRGSFDDFIVEKSRHNNTQQSDYLKGTDGDIRVDFIGRFENLEEDFRNITQRIGIASKLSHKNKSSHLPYQDVYSDLGRKLVAEMFAEDIERFNYSFGRP